MMTRRYVAAIKRWRAAGCPARNDAEVEKMLAICKACEHYDKGNCSQCGCRVNDSRWSLTNKIRMATENCPAGKW